jgi:NAD(P)-dependent dehydrogenase (short-subunit alcohol dehydrogenase family)
MKRLALITGGTKGLGREIALTFGRAGYSIVALYSSDEKAAEDLNNAFLEAHIEGSVVRQDVTIEESSLWNRTDIQQAQTLALIHNACAPFAPVPLHQLAWTDIESNFHVAVKGAWICAQALIRPMIKRGSGVIVNVLTSALSEPTPRGFAAYLTAKHALRGLTLALAAEYSERGVRVFSVSPGFMDTPLTKRWDPRLRDTVRAKSSHVSEPVEAARRLLELVTGETVPGRGEDYFI